MADPDAAAYKNGVDITNQVLVCSDDHVVSGNVLTLRKITARGADGARYVVVIGASVAGNQERRKLLICVARATAEG